MVLHLGKGVIYLKWLHPVAIGLVIIGALNWGLVGLLGINLVSMVFGSMPGIENIIYILVGASAVYSIFDHKKNCMLCNKMGKK